MEKGTEVLRIKKRTEGLKNKVEKFQMLVPGSVSGDAFSDFSRATPNSVLESYFSSSSLLKLALSTLLFVIVLLIGLGNPGGILAQEASEDSGLEDALSGFDDEASADENDATDAAAEAEQALAQKTEALAQRIELIAEKLEPA